MDKNAERIIPDSLQRIETGLLGSGPHLILASRPFHKAESLNLLLHNANCPALVLDFDLMYSGYVASNMIQARDNIQIIRPRVEDWNNTLRHILEKMCQERLLIIIDSFNGFHNMYSDMDSARFVNASLMLLAFVGRFKKCPVIAMALARKSKKDKWILMPGGRQIISPKNSNLYTVSKDGDTLCLTQCNHA